MSARPRVAVVGAGPAGGFAAAHLRDLCDADVDFFDRLPTPWGLLRTGVAPDHQEIKALQDRLDKITFNRGVRFYGNVEVGVDISHPDLLRCYDAVFYATGAQADRSLDIPGEDLAGSRTAREFVGWYNGHPDYQDSDIDLSTERAVVIGNGNVAMDVARVLAIGPDGLRHTDISNTALAALRASKVSEVFVVGRRGPAQASFSHAALRELLQLPDVDVIVAPDDVESDLVTSQDVSFSARKNAELLRAIAGRKPRAGIRSRVVLKFSRSAVQVHGDHSVESIELIRNDSSGTTADTPLEPPPVQAHERVECGLVLRAIGYRTLPVLDVPFNDQRHVIPNDHGRVLTPDGNRLPGVYVVGWAKRGPNGILGTNKRDAKETVESFIEDMASGGAGSHSLAAQHEIDAHLAHNGLDIVDLKGWRAIDAREVALGRADDRPRSKLTRLDNLLTAARQAL